VRRKQRFPGYFDILDILPSALAKLANAANAANLDWGFSGNFGDPKITWLVRRSYVSVGIHFKAEAASTESVVFLLSILQVEAGGPIGRSVV
jgi:hypothetical protein